MDFHKGAFLSLLCNIPFYKNMEEISGEDEAVKIWTVGNLVYSLKSNLIASK